MPRLRHLAHRRRCHDSASRRSWSPTARTACAASPTRRPSTATSGSLPATCFPTASALGSSWDPDLVRRVGAGDRRGGPRAGCRRWCSARASTSSGLRCAGATSSTTPRIRCSPACSAPRWWRGCRARGSAPRSSTSRSTTRRPTGCGSAPTSTSARCARSTCRRSSASSRTARPWTVMCAYNKLNGQYASQHHVAAHRRCCGTSGASTGWSCPTGVPCTTGSPPSRPAWTWRCRPTSGSATPRSSPPFATASSTRRSSTPPCVGCFGWSTALPPARPRASTSTPTTPWPAPRPPSAPFCCKNDDGVLPLATDSRRRRRGRRRVRPDPPLPGRRQLPGQPDPRRRAPRRAARRGAGRCARSSTPPGLTSTTTDDGRGPRRPRRSTLAAGATVVVAFLGLPPADESEGFDRTHIDLPDNQTSLLARLAEANPNLVVVLANGSAVRLSTWEHHARAVLECWLSGQAAGGAVADLLLGAANPSGRLAETLPLRLEDNPSYLNFPGEAGHVRYGEGVFVGYRGYDAVGREVSYPFGHGLSYTTFAYADLAVAVTGSAADGDLAITVTCTVTNTGDRAGKEIVQLYVGDPVASVARPARELKAFGKLRLEPGDGRHGHLPSRRPRPVLLVHRTPALAARGRHLRDRDRRLITRPAAHHHHRRAGSGRAHPIGRHGHAARVARPPGRLGRPAGGDRHRPGRAAARHPRRQRPHRQSSATSRSAASPPSATSASTTRR